MYPVPYNLPYYQINSPITLNTSFSLGWVPIYTLGYFAQIVWTGTPTGYFYLDASGDAYLKGTSVPIPHGAPFFHWPQYANPTNFNTIVGSQYNVVAAGSNSWNVNGSRYNFVRISYVDQSSGASTATLNFANVCQKGPG